MGGQQPSSNNVSERFFSLRLIFVRKGRERKTKDQPARSNVFGLLSPYRKSHSFDVHSFVGLREKKRSHRSIRDIFFMSPNASTGSFAVRSRILFSTLSVQKNMLTGAQDAKSTTTRFFFQQ